MHLCTNDVLKQFPPPPLFFFFLKLLRNHRENLTQSQRILQTVLADRRCGIAAFEGTETTWTVYATKQRQPKINPENLQMPVNPGPFNSAQLFLDPFDMFLRAHLDRVQNYFGSP